MEKELEEQLEQNMDDHLKSNIEFAKKELSKLSDGKIYSTFDELEPELVKRFCEENELKPQPDFLAAMTTPFSVGKYVSLVVEQEELYSEVVDDLKSFLDNKKTNWVVHKDFTNEITIGKHTEHLEVMPQMLTVRYKRNSETGKIVYAIKSKNSCWDISKENLKALVEGGEIVSGTGKVFNGKLNPIIKEVSENKFVLEIGDNFIITCKQK